MLVRCLYASRSAGPLTDAVLDGILRQARKHNPTHGITGMLCCAGDIFIQVIEGGREEISQLLGTIFRDPRHAGVQILSFEEIPERRFGHWTMGQVKCSNVNPALLLKYSDRAVLNPFTGTAGATMALLLEIGASGAIVNRPG